MKNIFSTINHFVDRFLLSMMIVVSFNLAVICITVLVGAGPELFTSVLHGWDGLDFLAVMFIPSTVGAILLVIGDVILKRLYESR